MTAESLISKIENIAQSFDLNFLGVAGVNVDSAYDRFEKWLDSGHHADMKFLENNKGVRANPKLLLEGAKSILVFAMPYNTGDKWQRGVGFSSPRIAMYARLKDYHKHLKKTLGQIANDLYNAQILEPSARHRVTVDTAPLLERSVAEMTQSGFIGKNTCFIHPAKGSFLLLGEIIVTADLIDRFPKRPRIDSTVRSKDGGCGSCKRCQVHCPTGALSVDFQIDARKCLSWWTIENRGTIPVEFWPWIGQYMFGCDICQLVCPWNRGTETLRSDHPLVKIGQQIDPFEIALMDQAKYESLFASTPVTRAKREGLIRNALIAMYATGHNRLADAISKLKEDRAPVIQATIEQINLELVIQKNNLKNS